MEKTFITAALIATLMMALGLVACTSGNSSSSSASSEMASGESSASAEAAAADKETYGYVNDDPVFIAVYTYLTDEVSTFFDKADVCLPVVSIVHVDSENPDEVLVYGDFWIYSYNIEKDVLMCVSGGNFPGVMHVSRDGGDYVVSSFDMVADGADNESSARELFGAYYEDYQRVHSDDVARADSRTLCATDYVILNGLKVYRYQDPGQEQVQLYMKVEN